MLTRAAIAALCIGCGPAVPALRATGGVSPKPTGTSLGDHCPYGLPRELTPHGKTVLVRRTAYALLHSASEKVPLWVCEHLTPSDLVGPAARSGRFFPDPMLAPGERAELSDYHRSGFDRGHMAAAANHKKNDEVMHETFFLSNMAPQVPETNRGPWAELEERVRAVVHRVGEAYVVTGPVFAAEVKTIGAFVRVPDAFYKVVVASQRAATVLMQNAGARASSVSVDEVESKTGFDFMPELPTNAVGPMESAALPLESLLAGGGESRGSVR